MVVNNNAAAVLLVLAALAAGPRRSGQPGESVEIGGVVPRPRRDRTVGCPPRRRGHHQPHPPRRLPTGHRQARRRRGDGAQGAPEQLPGRGVRRGDLGARTRHARRARGRRHRQRTDRRELSVAARRPAGVARRASRRRAQTIADRRRARHVQRRQAVRRPAGGHHRRARRPRRAVHASPAGPGPSPRWPGARVAAGDRTRLPRQRAATDVPFWAMVATPVADLRRRADAIVDSVVERHPTITAIATEALPGAGSAPGVTMPSYGLDLAGDHLAALRAPRDAGHRPRRATADVARPSLGGTRRRRHRSSPHCAPLRRRDGRRHRRPRRPRQVVARAGADRNRSRSVRGGEAARAHDRPRVRAHDAAVGCRS